MRRPPYPGLASFTLAALAAAAHAQPCEWTEVGGGMNVEVYALTVFDEALHAGGAFLFAGGIPALRTARWDGLSWSALGSGLTGPYNSPDAIAMMVFDDALGGGPALYVGGTFQNAGGAGAHYIARWDGASWSPLGAGVAGRVWSLAVFDGNLYAGGAFTSAGGVSTPNRVARWDGQSWSPAGLSHTSSNVRALAVYDNALYAGSWNPAGGVPELAIARWDVAAGEWLPVGSAGAGGLNGPVYALTVFEGGLYVGGGFTLAGALPVSAIARWDGAAWSDVGGGVTGSHLTSIRAMTVFDDGTGGGPALYAGGLFDMAGGVWASGIARWDGAQWSALGSGVGPTFNPTVHALAGFDDGEGRALFAGGAFLFMGGVPAERIARWRCEPFVPPCYPNCDGSTTEPILNVDDFICFINEFAAAQALPHEQQITHYANCDESTAAPVLNVDDFTCFINAFAQGCP